MRKVERYNTNITSITSTDRDFNSEAMSQDNDRYLKTKDNITSGLIKKSKPIPTLVESKRLKQQLIWKETRNNSSNRKETCVCFTLRNSYNQLHSNGIEHMKMSIKKSNDRHKILSDYIRQATREKSRRAWPNSDPKNIYQLTKTSTYALTSPNTTESKTTRVFQRTNNDVIEHIETSIDNVNHVEIERLKKRQKDITDQLKHKNSLINNLYVRLQKKKEDYDNNSNNFSEEQVHNYSSHSQHNENEINKECKKQIEINNQLVKTITQQREEIESMKQQIEINQKEKQSEIETASNKIVYLTDNIRTVESEIKSFEDNNEYIGIDINAKSESLRKYQKDYQEKIKEHKEINAVNSKLQEKYNEKDLNLQNLEHATIPSFGNQNTHLYMPTEPEVITHISSLSNTRFEETILPKEKIEKYRNKLNEYKEHINSQAQLIVMLKEDYKATQKKMNDLDIFTIQLEKLFNKAFANYKPTNQTDIKSFDLLKKIIAEYKLHITK